MNVSHLLNPAGGPDGEIRHSDNVETDIASRSFRATAPSPEDPFPLDAQEAWLEQVTSDRKLYGLVPAWRDRERHMRIHLSEIVSQLVRPPIEVVQETDLRTVSTYKREYKHTESFQNYLQHLNSGPAFSASQSLPSFPSSSTSSSYHTAADTSVNSGPAFSGPGSGFTAALRSLPSFPSSSTSSYHTARTAHTPSTSGSRSAGPCIIDIGFFIDIDEHTITNGTLELKKLKRKDVKGTPLDYPPGIGEPLPPVVRELPGATQTYIKRGLAQGIWYGAIEQEMMRSNGDCRLPPVLVGYVVNQFFVRILLLEDTIYIERDGDDLSLVNLEDYLELFKDGRNFPHHLSTKDGARALMEHVLAACRLLKSQESALQIDSEKSTNPDLFRATTQIGRTKSNTLAAAADLTSVTEDDLDKAEHHESPPSPPDRNVFPPSTPAFVVHFKPDSPPPTFTQAWIAQCELTDIDPPEEPDLVDSDERTDSASTTSSFDDIEEEEVTEHHIEALVSRYRFQCLSRDDFAQTLRRITA